MRGGGGVGVIINWDGVNVNAYKLLCHNKVTRRKGNKKFTFELKKFSFLFLLLNKDIKMLLKFKKKFHKSLITDMFCSKLRKRENKLKQCKFFSASVKCELCSKKEK